MSLPPPPPPSLAPEAEPPDPLESVELVRLILTLMPGGGPGRRGPSRPFDPFMVMWLSGGAGPIMGMAGGGAMMGGGRPGPVVAPAAAAAVVGMAAGEADSPEVVEAMTHRPRPSLRFSNTC